MKSAISDIKVGIIGLGLIGGSIARALKARADITVRMAVDHDERSLIKAASDGCIKEFSTDIFAVRDCDIVFICVPVSATISVLDKIKDFYTGIVTDTASTKSSIDAHVRTNCPGMRFIGAHPMAGSDKTGYGASSAGLYENAPYIICDSSGISVSEDDKRIMESLIGTMGARILHMDISEHDRAVGLVSHLPHVAAYALVEALSAKNDDKLKTIAAGGFKDITRIVSSDPALWADILCDSGETVLDLIDDYSVSLGRIRDHIAAGDREGIKAVFESAKNYRESVDLPGTYRKEYVQIWVDVDDKPGMIASVAGIFADAGINIRNIAIQDSREYEGGSLRITVQSGDDAARGTELLTGLGMRARVVR